jgi:hypothetical protein
MTLSLSRRCIDTPQFPLRQNKGSRQITSVTDRKLFCVSLGRPDRVVASPQCQSVLRET